MSRPVTIKQYLVRSTRPVLCDMGDPRPPTVLHLHNRPAQEKFDSDIYSSLLQKSLSFSHLLEEIKVIQKSVPCHSNSFYSISNHFVTNFVWQKCVSAVSRQCVQSVLLRFSLVKNSHDIMQNTEIGTRFWPMRPYSDPSLQIRILTFQNSDFRLSVLILKSLSSTPFLLHSSSPKLIINSGEPEGGVTRHM